MNPELQQFARQLATWTELIIDHGRTPFRRVDLFPVVHTAQGALQPPLIFWINRQSMMAGGILLLPEQNLEVELDRGRGTAEALGLRHFVTWETDQVRIWELQGTSSGVHQQFDFPRTEDPDAYRQLLGKVLESLKLLAVLGLVPPAELSADYLHNLFQTTLEVALPPLVNSYRSQRALEESQEATDADSRAEEAARFTLLQLLTLLWHQQLPSSILPEKLERAIELSLPNLPESLQQPLSRKVLRDQPPLPHDSAVCFHHLLLRLRQIAWNQPEKRALKALESLTDSWYPAAAGCGEGQVCLYPQSPKLTAKTQVILSDSPVLLAVSALLDELHKRPARQQLFGTTFKLDLQSLQQCSIVGQLTGEFRPSREERQQFGALLRTSWPNRRFRLASDAPLWLWESLHLLGLGKQGFDLLLRLPLQALQTPAEGPLWSILVDSYGLSSVGVTDTDLINLQLCEATEAATTTEIQTATDKRVLVRAKTPAIIRSQILLALHLPAEIYRLLEHELVWPERQAAEYEQQAGLLLYAATKLGQGLWNLLSDAPLPESSAALAEAAVRSGWPVPETEILAELETATRSRQRAHGFDLDQILVELLACPELANLELPAIDTSKPTFVRRQLSDKELRDELIQRLIAEGIPTFPEQYLYFLEKPEMVRYQLQPPLEIVSEFLGQIILRDSAGQSIQVYGQEQADALLLCAELKKTDIELPGDRQQISLLLDHYRQDLVQLLQHLNSLCYSRLESANAARKLARKVWKKLNVPNLKWLKD